MAKMWKLSYLPLFEQDIADTCEYISTVLQNPHAAQRLVDETEQAILKRLEMPDIFSPYPSLKPHKHKYYRINVRNFSVFYVLIDDVMEVRRFIYGRRDIDAVLGDDI
jgi:plasmid stabilization system protein ParE